MESIENWIFNYTSVTPDEATLITQFVNIILTIMDQTTLTKYANEFLQIQSLLENPSTMTISDTISLVEIIGSIIVTVMLVFSDFMKVEITDGDIKSVTENIKLFLITAVLIILYKVQNQINVQAIIPLITVIIDVVSIRIDVNPLSFMEKIKKRFNCVQNIRNSANSQTDGIDMEIVIPPAGQ